MKILDRELFDSEIRILARIKKMNYSELEKQKEMSFILMDKGFKFLVEATILMRENELAILN